MNGFQGHKHLNGGTVRVGDDAVMPFEVFRVHFGNDEGAAVIHAPGGGVVHDNAAGMSGIGGKLRRRGAAGGEDGDVDADEGIFLQFMHGQFGIAVRHLHAFGSGGSESQNFTGRKVTVMQRLQHFTAYSARGAADSNSQLFAHWIFSSGNISEKQWHPREEILGGSQVHFEV